FDSVPPDMALLDLIAKFAQEHTRGYPVIDAQGKLAGVVTMRDVEEALIGGRAAGDGNDPTPFGRTVRDVCTRNVIVCRPDQTLGDALAQFGADNFGQLPVIDPDDPERMLGLLRRSDIIAAYTDARKRSAEMLPKADAMKTLSEEHETVIERAHIAVGSMLADTLVKDAGFPEGTVLMKVSRAHEVIVPRGSTRIQAGDRITVITTRAHAKLLRKWLKQHC
ncbi:MAG: CBS domain-containing protein, partial [Alphaproteobacteria bacterium]